MWMTDYIREIQKRFVVDYKFTPRSDAPLIPAHVPDGEYPMTIAGKYDNVRVTNGTIDCCNFDEVNDER